MNDTRFSSAIHTLILISEAEKPMTSAQIAHSVGTNASAIRRLVGLLKRQGVVSSGRGISGFRLALPPEKITLHSVYAAIYASEQVHIFDLHQNPSDACVVGRHILPLLAEAFRPAEEQAALALRTITLADCIRRMKAIIRKEEE